MKECRLWHVTAFYGPNSTPFVNKTGPTVVNWFLAVLGTQSYADGLQGSHQTGT